VVVIAAAAATLVVAVITVVVVVAVVVVIAAVTVVVIVAVIAVTVVQVHNLLSEILKTEKLRKLKVFSWRSSAHQSSRLGQTCPDATHSQSSTLCRCVASRRSKLGMELHSAGCVSHVSALLRVSQSARCNVPLLHVYIHVYSLV
jgi:hypothetical protein